VTLSRLKKPELCKNILCGRINFSRPGKISTMIIKLKLSKEENGNSDADKLDVGIDEKYGAWSAVTRTVSFCRWA